MKDTNIEELKHLVPDFEQELKEEKDKAVKYALAYLSEEYSYFETSLMSMMKKYDELVSKGYEGLHAKHRSNIGGYTYIFKKPHNAIEEEKAKIVAKIESEFQDKINQLQENYIQELLSEELAEKEAERLNEIEKEKNILKEKLLSTLFK